MPEDRMYTSPSTWDLGADPDHLDQAADKLKTMGSGAAAAQETVDTAASKVAADGGWDGDTAAAYQDHRTRLTADLGGASSAADDAATALMEIAEVLRKGQGMLADQRDRLADVPQQRFDGGMRLYEPRDEEEAGLVKAATEAAAEIRSRVDEEILARKPAIDAAGQELATIRDTWGPREVRHVNLNTGMFKGAGTLRSNLDELAASIASGDPDVATLQEVIEYNLHGEDGLLAHLERITGAEWEVASFAEADRRVVNWDSDVPVGTYSVGNAVLIRTDRAVTGSTELPAVDLSTEAGDGYSSNRVAAVAELTLAEPGR